MGGSLIKQIGDYGLLSGVIPMLLIAILYLVRSRWWDNWTGRALMMFFCSLGLILLFVVLTLFTGADWPGRIWVRTAVYLTFPVSAWGVLFVLLYQQQRVESERASKTDAEGKTK
jgi:hypothetical protein